eukprot:scpid35177/ scgid1874/ 
MPRGYARRGSSQASPGTRIWAVKMPSTPAEVSQSSDDGDQAQNDAHQTQSADSSRTPSPCSPLPWSVGERAAASGNASVSDLESPFTPNSSLAESTALPSPADLDSTVDLYSPVNRYSTTDLDSPVDLQSPSDRPSSADWPSSVNPTSSEDRTSSVDLPSPVDRTSSVDLPSSVDRTSSVYRPSSVDWPSAVNRPSTVELLSPMQKRAASFSDWQHSSNRQSSNSSRSNSRISSSPIQSPNPGADQVAKVSHSPTPTDSTQPLPWYEDENKCTRCAKYELFECSCYTKIDQDTRLSEGSKQALDQLQRSYWYQADHYQFHNKQEPGTESERLQYHEELHWALEIRYYERMLVRAVTRQLKLTPPDEGLILHSTGHLWYIDVKKKKRMQRAGLVTGDKLEELYFYVQLYNKRVKDKEATHPDDSADIMVKMAFELRDDMDRLNDTEFNRKYRDFYGFPDYLYVIRPLRGPYYENIVRERQKKLHDDRKLRKLEQEQKMREAAEKKSERLRLRREQADRKELREQQLAKKEEEKAARLKAKRARRMSRLEASIVADVKAHLGSGKKSRKCAPPPTRRVSEAPVRNVNQENPQETQAQDSGRTNETPVRHVTQSSPNSPRRTRGSVVPVDGYPRTPTSRYHVKCIPSPPTQWMHRRPNTRGNPQSLQDGAVRPVSGVSTARSVSGLSTARSVSGLSTTQNSRQSQRSTAQTRRVQWEGQNLVNEGVCNGVHQPGNGVARTTVSQSGSAPSMPAARNPSSKYHAKCVPSPSRPRVRRRTADGGNPPRVLRPLAGNSTWNGFLIETRRSNQWAREFETIEFPITLGPDAQRILNRLTCSDLRTW